MRARRWVSLALLSAAALWMAVLIGTTRLAAIPRDGANSWFTPLVYWFGSVICHQRPERSFVLWQAQMPVCARCTGIYLGALVATVALCFAVPARQLSSRGARVLLSVAALPTAITLVYEWTTGSMPSNAWRAAAGAPLGLAATVVIGALLLAPSTSTVQSSYTSVP